MNTQTPPAVPVGLSTKLGLTVSGIAGVLAALSVVLNGDVTDETVASLATGIVTLYAVIQGRMDQAAAASMNPARPVGVTVTNELAGPDRFDAIAEAHERAIAAVREGALLTRTIDATRNTGQENTTP